jgi:hypothetical protein
MRLDIPGIGDVGLVGRPDSDGELPWSPLVGRLGVPGEVDLPAVSGPAEGRRRVLPLGSQIPGSLQGAGVKAGGRLGEPCAALLLVLFLAPLLVVVDEGG